MRLTLLRLSRSHRRAKTTQKKGEKKWRTSRYFIGFNVCTNYICKCWWSQAFYWLVDYLIWQHIVETKIMRGRKKFSLTCAWQKIFSSFLCLKILWFWYLFGKSHNKRSISYQQAPILKWSWISTWIERKELNLNRSDSNAQGNLQ